MSLERERRRDREREREKEKERARESECVRLIFRYIDRTEINRSMKRVRMKENIYMRPADETCVTYNRCGDI